jgi:hypothetical protein
MSVTTVKLHSQGASGTATGTDNGNVTASYRSAYRVQVSDPSDGPDYVLNYFLLNADYPWPGRTFHFGSSFDVSAVCRTVDANYEEKSNGWFTVSCTFVSERGGGDQQQQTGTTPEGKNSQDPTQWHDEIDVSFTQISVPAEVAIFRGFVPQGINNPYLRPGRIGPVVNSALKPYDPTLEEEVDIKVIRITKNAKSYDGRFYSRYQGAVNNDTVTISKNAYRFKETFKPYQGRIKVISGQFAIANGIPYWRQTIEVHVHPAEAGWRRFIVDRGMDARRGANDPNGKGGTVSASDVLNAGTVNHEAIKDSSGTPISEPVLLDGNGQPLATDKPPVYLVYSTRIEIPFAGIRW